MITPFKSKKPHVHSSAFVAPSADLIGDVRLASGVSVWFGAVLRADLAGIRVGKNTNIQDNCVLHVDHDVPCILKENIVMGHQATAHSCVIEDGALIGIGARILSGARIGAFSLIGAGAVVLENASIPKGSLVLGVPGKVIRKLTEKEVRRQAGWALGYVEIAKEYKKYLG